MPPAPPHLDVFADLAAESDDLDRLVAPLDAPDWRQPTPAVGWTIAHQIAHLAWTDQVALLAVTDPAAFTASISAFASDPAAAVEAGAAEGLTTSPAELLARWRAGRVTLGSALVGRAADGGKVPWFGPPMSPRSMATARLMETWAHGEDVADALGAPREPTNRLRHVAHIGVRTRDFAFLLNGRTPPSGEFHVALTGPAGDEWTWGPADAEQRVTGPAADFCLVVTQRRHRADTALVAVGADADAWLDIAQAYAGAPGAGRSPSGPA